MDAAEYKAAAEFWKAKDRNDMPKDQVKAAVEEYLDSNSVCALATGAGDFVRCTPLEYSYHDGAFWIFTEGGEKFVGLARNPNVSLAVFDRDPGFGGLSSVQVMGRAELVEPMSGEYLAHAEYKKVPEAALRKLADEGHPMHLLRITPVRIDVLFSAFKEQGFDSRQSLDRQSLDCTEQAGSAGDAE